MFPKMAEILNNRDGDRFRLERFTISPEEAVKTKAKAAGTSFQVEVEDLLPGDYVNLIDKHLCEIVMSDHAMERRTNAEIYKRASGDVLIGGLGLGMIVLALQEKPDVRSITVIEKFPEIIDMVVSQLPLSEKVTVVDGDIFTWVPAGDSTFDVIYFDIWNDITGENYQEMTELHRRFRPFLRPGSSSWIGSWRYFDCRRMHQKGMNYSDPKRRAWRESKRERLRQMLFSRQYRFELPAGFTPIEHLQVLNLVIQQLSSMLEQGKVPAASSGMNFDITLHPSG